MQDPPGGNLGREIPAECARDYIFMQENGLG